MAIIIIKWHCWHQNISLLNSISVNWILNFKLLFSIIWLIWPERRAIWAWIFEAIITTWMLERLFYDVIFIVSHSGIHKCPGWPVLFIDFMHLFSLCHIFRISQKKPNRRKVEPPNKFIVKWNYLNEHFSAINFISLAKSVNGWCASSEQKKILNHAMHQTETLSFLFGALAGNNQACLGTVGIFLLWIFVIGF